MKQKLILIATLTGCLLFFFSATAQVTGENVTYVEYPGGNFSKRQDGMWTEKGATRNFFFKVTSKDACCVYLYDASRSMQIQFNLQSKEIYMAQAGETQWTKLYDITNAHEGPIGYIKCAEENGTFVVPSNISEVDVAYGANGKFKYKSRVRGTIVFDNKTFGDPIPGVVKSGYYRPSPLRVRSESGD